MKKIFENDQYTISLLDGLNYAIDFKGATRQHLVKNRASGTRYSPLEWKLDFAHKQAKHIISQYSEFTAQV